MLSLHAATIEDIPTILKFIRDLAEYERLASACVADEEKLRRTLFGNNPAAFVTIAQWDGAPAGFALAFRSYSTFLATEGIWLEDLFVDPAFRGKGIGKALLLDLREKAQNQGGRLEWSVLKWNQPSIDFYESLGAERMEEWVTYRLAPDNR